MQFLQVRVAQFSHDLSYMATLESHILNKEIWTMKVRTGFLSREWCGLCHCSWALIKLSFHDTHSWHFLVLGPWGYIQSDAGESGSFLPFSEGACVNGVNSHLWKHCSGCERVSSVGISWVCFKLLRMQKFNFNQKVCLQVWCYQRHDLAFVIY